MITTIEENIFNVDTDAILHGCNCFHTMGGGIARQIKEKYPHAYMADCATQEGSYEKMGNFSFAIAPDKKIIYNCYTQFRFGTDRRHTDYEAVFRSLSAVKVHAESKSLKRIALPYKMCCVLGGGDWRIVETMITCVFENAPFDTIICKYNPQVISYAK